MMSDLPIVACSLLFTMELRAAETGDGSEVRVLLVFAVGLLIGVLFSVSELGLVPVLPVVPVLLGVPVGFGFFHIGFGPFVRGVWLKEPIPGEIAPVSAGFTRGSPSRHEHFLGQIATASPAEPELLIGVHLPCVAISRNKKRQPCGDENLPTAVAFLISDEGLRRFLSSRL